MKLRNPRKPRFSIEDIEREATAEIETRVSMGRPPPEEWKGVEQLDVDLPGWSEAAEPPTAAPPPEVPVAGDVSPSEPPAKARPARTPTKAAAKSKAAPKAVKATKTTTKTASASAKASTRKAPARRA